MQRRMSAEAAGSLIEAIYGCALDPARWPAVLRRLHECLGFDNASFSVIRMPSGEMVLNETVGIDPSYAGSMASYGPDVIEMWGGAARIAAFPMSEPAVLSRVTLPEALRTSRYYREWGEPQGLTDMVALKLTGGDEMIASIAMGRHRNSGAITDPDVAGVRLLLPHLQQAFALSRRLNFAVAEVTRMRGMLDGLAAPCFVVDATLRLLQVNSAGEKALVLGDPLHLRGGRLCCTDPRFHDVMTFIGGHAGPPAATHGCFGTSVPLRQRDGSVLALHAQHLWDRGAPWGGDRQAGVMLFLSRRGRDDGAAAALVAAAFQLTAMEARVFALVAQGCSVKQAARELDVQPSTVRTHLLRVYGKLGVHRQADLVRLAASFVSPMAPDGRASDTRDPRAGRWP